MAWNPPALFAADEIVTAAKMNQIRESILYLKGQGGRVDIEDDLRLPAGKAFQISTDVEMYRGASDMLRMGNALTVDNGLYVNGGAISILEAFVVAQASNKHIIVSAEGITGTQGLASGVVRGVYGTGIAYGSSTGWLNLTGNAVLSGSTQTIFNFHAEFVVELTAGGTIQARRVSGSQTWATIIDVLIR